MYIITRMQKNQLTEFKSLLLFRTSQNTGNKRELPEGNREHLRKPGANIFNGETLDTSTQDQEQDRDLYSHCIYLTVSWKFQTVQEGGKKNGWQRELSLLTGNIIVYSESPLESKNKLIKLINKLATHRIHCHTQKSVVFLYTNNNLK